MTDGVDIEVTIHAQTDKALCVCWPECPTPYKLPWWPRSQMTRLDGRQSYADHETVKVRIPRWLAQRYGVRG